MKFAPKPENDFAHFIKTYYDECRARFDRIEAIAGKWMFRDLIPGMSDFDTRFIVADGMTADDWCEMSTAIGRTHRHLCQLYPSWARNLEHLPGINLTWEEFTNERMYYPEFRQWSFYYTEDRKKLTENLEKLHKRQWDIKDEYFFLKKFCLYYGRYNRTIDQPINLGVHENKYLLHSRIMHYFEPPVQSAVILLKKQIFAGKFEAFEVAEQMFPGLECWDSIREILHANYEIPECYEETYLVKLEDQMEHALEVIAKALREIITIVPASAGVNINKWRQELKKVNIDPAMIIFDNMKFSRLMKGRIWFYANAPEHFDFTWLIQNELKRMNTSYIKIPFTVFRQLKNYDDSLTPTEIVEELRGGILDDREADAVIEFNRLTPGHWQEGTERNIALALVDIFDDFFRALTKISKEAIEFKTS